MLELLVPFLFLYSPADRLPAICLPRFGCWGYCGRGAALGGQSVAEAAPRRCHQIDSMWRDDDVGDGMRMFLGEASRTRMLCDRLPLPPHCVLDAAHKCAPGVLMGEFPWLLADRKDLVELSAQLLRVRTCLLT